MDELERFNEIVEKIGKRADGILEKIKEAQKAEIKEQYTAIADEMCKNYCVINMARKGNKAEAFGKMYDRACDDCPLMRGYKLCI